MAATLQEAKVTVRADGLVFPASRDQDKVTLVISVQTDADCLLHWGLCRRPGSAWQRPPASSWPEGTVAASGQAVRTPFAEHGKGERAVSIQLALPCPG